MMAAVIGHTQQNTGIRGTDPPTMRVGLQHGRWKAVITMAKTVDELSSTQVTDTWSGLLDHYRETAVRILGLHHKAGTRCESCGQDWPCKAACAAELALDL
jgi:hypothetical protein